MNESFDCLPVSVAGENDASNKHEWLLFLSFFPFFRDDTFSPYFFVYLSVIVIIGSGYSLSNPADGQWASLSTTRAAFKYLTLV